MDEREKVMSLPVEVFIIENNIESKEQFTKRGYGNSNVILNLQHMEALRAGKCIGIYNGEYTSIISLEMGDRVLNLVDNIIIDNQVEIDDLRRGQ